MASISVVPASGLFRIQFRFGGKQFQRSLKTSDEKQADGIRARVEQTLADLQRGRLQVPPGADPGAFILSDGRLERKPVIEAPPTATSLAGLFTLYKATLTGGSKGANTLRTESIHQAHALRLLGDVPVTSITLREAQSYADRRAKEKYRGNPTKPYTIRKELKTLRRIWAWGHGRGHLDTAPTWTIGELTLAREEGREPFRTMAEIRERIGRGGLKDDEIKALWECLYLTGKELIAVLGHVEKVETDLFVYPMFCFCALTGARRSEMLRSRVDDFDFRNKKVMIREKKRVMGKSSTRSVDMHPMLERVMRQWFKDHPGGQFTLCQDDGAPLNLDLMDHRFAYALKGSTWSVIRGFHTFRHSFASILASRGVDQRIINAFMGHQTPEQELRYRHLFPKTLRGAIKELLT